MNSTRAQQLLKIIDSTIEADIRAISGKDPLTDAYLAKFLVVYISGIYEEIIESIVNDFVHKNSQKREVGSLVRSLLGNSFRNPDVKNILTLMKRLDHATLVPVIKMMRVEGDALTSIVSNKNKIAHGENSQVTLTDVIGYYKTSRNLIEQIDRLLS